MSENPRDPLKEGCFHCAGNSLSGIRYICHMSVTHTVTVSTAYSLWPPL